MWLSISDVIEKLTALLPPIPRGFHIPAAIHVLTPGKSTQIAHGSDLFGMM